MVTDVNRLKALSPQSRAVAVRVLNRMMREPRTTEPERARILMVLLEVTVWEAAVRGGRA